MRLELPHIAARVIHLQQGTVVRLRPRLARIGRRRALSPAGCVLQHAVQRADDLRPVADAVGRQALPRQWVDAVRQLRQQRPRAFQFHSSAPFSAAQHGGQISSSSQSRFFLCDFILSHREPHKQDCAENCPAFVKNLGGRQGIQNAGRCDAASGVMIC